MKTGVVIDNYDPTFKNRCKVRVYGLHTETVNGQYVILDDDLPWALPAPNSGNGMGSSSVPKIGERVYIDVSDAYNMVYYGRVENKNGVKELQYENADDNDRMKIIAYSNDPNSDGTVDYLKIYYIPENGLTIECDGNVISLPKHNQMEIKTKGGAGISISTEQNDITIHTDSNVNLDCNTVNLTSKAMVDDPDLLILGKKLMEKFNNHTHMDSFGNQSMTPDPQHQIIPDDFSKNIYIG